MFFSIQRECRAKRQGHVIWKLLGDATFKFTHIYFTQWQMLA